MLNIKYGSSKGVRTNLQYVRLGCLSFALVRTVRLGVNRETHLCMIPTSISLRMSSYKLTDVSLYCIRHERILIFPYKFDALPSQMF
jgi:hypothetical protein